MSLHCRHCGSGISKPKLEKAVPKDIRALKAFWGSYTGANFTYDELAHVFVARFLGADGVSRIVGTVEALPCKKDLYLCRLKVANGFRRQGLGARLVRAVIAEAKTAGYPLIFAVTKNRPDVPSVRLMRRYGALSIQQRKFPTSIPQNMVARYSETRNFFWQFCLKP